MTDTKNFPKIQFVMICLVIFMHSYNISPVLFIESKESSLGFQSFLEVFLSHGLGRIATPSLFVISGWLLCYSEKAYWVRLLARIKGLWIPFVIWNIYTVVTIMIIVKLMEGKWLFYGLVFPPFLSKFISMPFWEIFYRPVNYPLWFVLDLLVLHALSNVLKFGMKKVPYLLLLASLIGSMVIYQYPVFFSTESLFYFLLGMMIYQSKLLLRLKPCLKSIVAIFMMLLLLKTSFHFVDYQSKYLAFALARAMEFSGIMVVFLLPWEQFLNGSFWDRLINARFMLFVGATPWLDFWRFNTYPYKLLSYALGAIVIIASLVCLDRILRLIPAYQFLTGNRKIA